MSLRPHGSLFNAKIKRVVRSLLEHSPEFSKVPNNVKVTGISEISNAANPIFLRLFWALVVLGCVTICMFQVYDRVSYYISEPVVVDITFEEEPNVKFPSVTLGSSQTTGIRDLLQKHNIKINEKQCGNPVMVLLDQVKGLDVDKLWTLLNFTPSVQGAAIVTPKHQYEVRGKEVVADSGNQLRFEPDQFLTYNSENKFMFKVSNVIPSCKTGFVVISIQSHGMPTDRKTSLGVTKLATIDLLITVKKLTFLNRRNQPCTNDAAYYECWRQCTVEKFKNMSCRFPFLPKEIKKSTCISGPGMGKVYSKALMTFATLYCHCMKRCYETTFQINARYVQQNRNNSVISVYMVSNRVTIITERFAYDIISLLSDVGGMLGLSLGLSILSIIEVLQYLILIVVKRLRNKEQQTPIFYGDPVFSFVKRILSEELHDKKNNQQLLKTNTPVPLRLFQAVVSMVLVSCVASSCLFMGVRIFKYSSEPTHMAVQFVFNDSVHFPNITICSLSTPIVVRLKKLANQKEDWCYFHLTDLLDDPTTNAEMLWKESSTFKEHEESIDIAKMQYNKSLLENISVREVSLPHGKCAEIHVGTQLFSGSLTKYLVQFVSLAFNEFKNELLKCDRHYQELFITPTEELFHFNTRLQFPTAMRTSLILYPKQVTMLNTRRSPCVAQEVAKACYTRCFQSKLLKHISCRLPYMPPAMNNLPTCNTSQSGKQAHAAYMTEALTLDSIQENDCACTKSCKSMIITTAMLVEPLLLTNFTRFSMHFLNNIKEHITEVAADSLSSLLCDIGGNLGLTLGLSVLSLFDLIQSLLGKLQLKLKHVFTL